MCKFLEENFDSTKYKKITKAEDVPQELWGKNLLFYVDTHNEDMMSFTHCYVDIISGAPKLALITKHSKIILIMDEDLISTLEKLKTCEKQLHIIVG